MQISNKTTQTLIDFLDELAALGIRLWVEDCSLRCSAPVGKMTDEIRSRLKEHKTDLIRLLEKEGGEDKDAKSMLRPVLREGNIPLSYAQQSLWFLHEMESQSKAAYNVRVMLKLTGTLHADLWKRAFQEIVNRHEPLRTCFESVEGEPVQRILSTVEIPVEVIDYSHLSREEQENSSKSILDKEGKFSFDLTKAPLFRTILIKVDDGYYIILNGSHLIADAWSANLVLHELSLMYRALIEGRQLKLPELNIQYADYVFYQRQWLRGEDITPHLTYWKEQLRDLQTLNFPTDYCYPEIQTYEGESIPFQLSRELSNSLRDLSRKEGVTLYTTMLAAFAVLLNRYSGEEDIPIGASIAGRNLKEVEDQVGFFVNLLVLRHDFTGNPSFIKILERVQDVYLTGMKHSDVPFDLLVKELHPVRSPGRNPLIQFLFLFLQSTNTGVEVSGAKLETMQVPSVTSKFDFSLHVEDTGDIICGLIEYKTALFDASTIVGILAGWERILQSVVQNPQLPISEIRILSDEEENELITDRNRIDEVMPMHETLHGWFTLQARRNPESIALSAEKSSLTYYELETKANRLANYLTRKGVGPETLIGLYLETSPEMIIAILAILKAGGAYVPLDPEYPSDRPLYMIADSQTRILISTEDIVSRLNIKGSEIAVILLDKEVEAIQSEEETPPQTIVKGENAAYVIYTSGSTGEPKGVIVTHKNVTRLMGVTEALYQFNERDVWTLFHSVSFDFSVWEMWGALLYGGRLVIVPPHTRRSPEDFYRLLINEKVTVLNQTPSAFTQLMIADENLNEKTSLTSMNLRYVIFGGEALNIAGLKPWFNRHGDTRPQLVNMFGITETTVHVTYRPLTREDAEDGSGSLIGNRLSDLTLYILDQSLRPVPVGVIGELYVGGAGLARGYLGRAALTNERFIANPFGSERLYRTGDIARWTRRGDIEYCGRNDHQVKMRGFRIELGEIESVLMKHDLVQDAIVLMREDKPGEKKLTAYLVPSSENEIDPSSIRNHCQRKLPEYMIPVAFVPMNEWPLTDNKKLDRAALPAPDQNTSLAKTTYSAPRNEKERILAEVWSQVMEIKEIGIDDNFFDLGGDSILSLRLIANIRKKGLACSLKQLYKYQNIRQIANALDFSEGEEIVEFGLMPFALIGEEDRNKMPSDAEDAFPLSQLQAGMLYHREVNPDTAIYIDIFSFHMCLPWSETAWPKAFQKLIDSHSMLRASFHFAEFSEPLQIIHNKVTAQYTVEDGRTFSTAEQEDVITRKIENLKTKHFSIKNPPLLYFHLLRRSEDHIQITFSFHHAILDGWSVATMITQMMQDYFRELGRSIPYREKSQEMGFSDFVYLERRESASKAHRVFWEENLNKLNYTSLPRWPHPVQTGRDIKQLKISLSAGLSSGISSLAKYASTPVKTVCLAAHLRALALWYNRHDVVTGLVSNGRPEMDGAETVLGLFLNTVPFQMELKDGSFKDLLKQTFRTEQEYIPNRRFPTALLKQMNNGKPLYDAGFNFIHFHVYGDVVGMDDFHVIDYRVFEETEFSFVAIFSIDPQTGFMGIEFMYDGAQFPEEQIHEVSSYYLRILEAMVHDPEQDHQRCLIIASAERNRLLQEIETIDYKKAVGIHEWFYVQAMQTPDRIALVCDGSVITYQELDIRSNRLAHYLIRLGVGPEVLVGICMERSPDIIIAVLGILKAGGGYVPIEPANPEERVAFILEDGGIKVLITSQPILSQFNNATTHLENTVLLDKIECDLQNENSEPPAIKIEPENVAYVIYTSGSTGMPKGVVITHNNVTRLMAATEEWYNFSETDIWTYFHSTAFDFSVWEMWGALLYGGKLVIVSYTVSRSPRDFYRLLIDEQVTVLNQTPSAFGQLLPIDSELRGKLNLRYVIFGGEALELSMLKDWFEDHGDEQPRLINMYGITETTVHVTYRPLKKEDSINKSGSIIGKPIRDLSLYLLDEQMEPVPTGVSGELYVGGAGLARCYLNRDELTKERFISNPFGSGRLYKTGDLARRLPDSDLEFIGRVDRQEKIRGFRIELGEIESVLLKSPGVQSAAVIVREDKPGDKRLTAYIVRKENNETATVESLHTSCQDRLPDYMVPGSLIFLPSLPLTSNGKLDYKALPEPNALALADANDDCILPSTDLEKTLCSMWSEVLDVDTIGINQNFFELGGHSLVATQLISRIRVKFSIELSITSLFDEPTVEGLAKIITEKQTKQEQITITPILKAKKKKTKQITLSDGGNII